VKRNLHIDWRVWLVLTVSIAVILLTAFWASTHMPVPPPFTSRVRPPAIAHEDIELYYTAKTIFATLNVTLLIFLLATYLQMYISGKSEFTLWLAIISTVLLLNALTSNPLVHWIFGFRAFGLGPFAMLPDIFTLVALAILLYLTMKY
jgi:hypothetical protein